MHNLSIRAMLCWFVFANGICVAQEEKPVRSFTWNAQHDCELALRTGTLIVQSTGQDPYFSTLDVPAIAQPLTLEFRMKSQAEGGGQLFWSTQPAPDKADTIAKNQTTFAVTHNALWHEYRVPFQPRQPLKSLRFDPCSAPGEIQIEGLRLVDAEGIIIKQWLPLRCCTEIDGNATIRNRVGEAEIVITTTARLAGAIHSLTWNGKEFIDSVDHGRQMQSACSFGGLNRTDTGPFHAECYNPTEAGSRMDGAGNRSSSRLLEINRMENAIQTLTQMAFWLAPWEKSEKKPALNTESRSKHTVAKQVRIGYRDLPNVLQYHVTFRVPVGEEHRLAQFESLTAYMPVEFDHFYGFNAGDGALQPLSNTRGEQALPMVLATADGKFAMGVFSPEPTNKQLGRPSYGRFDFRQEHVMKWNCVYRVRNKNGVEPGEYAFSHFVAVGDLAMVQQSLRKLHEEFK